MMMKSMVLEELIALLGLALLEIDAEIDSLHVSRTSEGKSSAGDKHETGRAMIDQALQHIELQRAKTAKMLADARSLSSSPCDTVRAGALVKAAGGWFLLAVSWGKLTLQGGESVAVVSPISPVAQAMLGKRVGDTFELNGRNSSVEWVG